MSQSEERMASLTPTTDPVADKTSEARPANSSAASSSLRSDSGVGLLSSSSEATNHQSPTSPSSVLAMSPTRKHHHHKHHQSASHRLLRYLHSQGPDPHTPCDIVVIPSLTLDSFQLTKVKGLLHFEERWLFHLLLLRHPHLRLFLFTSLPVDPSIVEYHLSLIDDAIVSLQHASSRLHLFTPNDASTSRCLSQKILMRPSLIRKVKSIIEAAPSMPPPASLSSSHRQQQTSNNGLTTATINNIFVNHTGCNKSNACLEVFRGTWYEEEIAKQLALPLESSKPSDLFWGSKVGSRIIFRDTNIPHPDGTYEMITDVDELLRQALLVLERNPDAKKALVKLNEGFSGKGNAFISVEPTSKILHDTETYPDPAVRFQKAMESLKQAYTSMRFVAPSEKLENFTHELSKIGAIFELFITSRHTNNHATSSSSPFNLLQTSPSVQCVVHPAEDPLDNETVSSSSQQQQRVEVISTHEQMLDGQNYLGCVFPAQACYRHTLMDYGRRVGEFLKEKGVSDHFSVDFMCDAPVSFEEGEGEGRGIDSDLPNGGWDIMAVEVNLRMTGTSHPMMTMQHLTNGKFVPDTGLFEITLPTHPPLLPPADTSSKASPNLVVANDNNNRKTEHRCYLSTDCFVYEPMKSLVAADIIETFKSHPLHWNHSTKIGTVFHMLGSLELSQLGMTCIHRTEEECKKMYRDVTDVLKRMSDEHARLVKEEYTMRDHFFT